MANLKLEIISPTGVLFKGECSIVTIPSAEGEMGVMYGHEAVIASLQEGKIQVFDASNAVVKTFDVKSGFAEMQGQEKLLVLLDS
jgi:F-type H+-transporting ATPase subunit epsilon